MLGGDQPVAVAAAAAAAAAAAEGDPPVAAAAASGGDPPVAAAAASEGDLPADVTPAPVTVWGTPVVAARLVLSAPVGPSVVGSPPKAPVPVVVGALIPLVSPETNIEAITRSMTEQSDMVQQMMEEDMSDDNLLKMSQKIKNIESEKMNSKVKTMSSQMSTESESDFICVILISAP